MHETGLILDRMGPPQAFQARTPRLRCQPRLPLRAARLGRTPLDRPDRGAANEVDKTFHGIGAVALARAKALRRDDDDAIACDPATPQLFQSMTDIFMQRGRRIDVEAELYRGCDFVDILAARATGTDEVLLELGLIECYRGRDAQHAT